MSQVRRKEENRRLRAMTQNLIKKTIQLSSRFEVDVLIVVFNRITFKFEEFCSTDHQHLFDDMMVARQISRNINSYAANDLSTLLSEDRSSDVSPDTRKVQKNADPDFSIGQQRTGHRQNPKELKELAELKSLLLRKPTHSASSRSTDDTKSTVASAEVCETVARGTVETDRDQEKEDWKDSPSDYLFER